jgi:hypothetical protein
MAARLQLQVSACRLLEQSHGSESKDHINYNHLIAKKERNNTDNHILLNKLIGIRGFLQLVLPYMQATHSHLLSFMILVYYLKTI